MIETSDAGKTVVVGAGGEDGFGMGGMNGILGLGVLGLIFGRNGGLFGGNGGSDTAFDAMVAANQATTATAQVQTFQTIQASMDNLNLQNQLNNIQADAASNAVAVSNALAQQQANNDIKLLLTRISDGNIDLARQFADCCCENKVLGLQNTAQIVAAVQGEGAATRALINQIRLDDLQTELTDAKLQISNTAQTLALENFINTKFPTALLTSAARTV